MYEFDLIKPASLAEALAVLAADDDAKYLSGGQTLLPTMKQRLASPSKLVALSGLDELRGVRVQNAVVEIGAATPHAVVAREAALTFPALASLAGRIGDPAVRNRGTIGGSVANNDPAACYPAAVLACGATIVTDRRSIAADDYFQGTFATALGLGEIVTSVQFPIPLAAWYEKFIQPASRFSLCSVFVARFADRVGIAVTGASSDGVFRWKAAEAALAERFDPAALNGLSLPEKGMIADSFGSAAYRAHLVPVLTARALDKLNARA
jgi:carbon-monoxide dehydrogenase medium subunit